MFIIHSGCSTFKGLSLLVILLVLACGACAQLPADAPFIGKWRATLDTSGGELPFFIEITAGDQGGMEGCVRNGIEALPFTSIETHEREIKLNFDHYDSYLVGGLDEAGLRLEGAFIRNKGQEYEKLMDFSATLNCDYRFKPLESKTGYDTKHDDVSGTWNVVFGEGENAWPAHAVLKQEGSVLSGTMLTRVGDFRYLAGSYSQGKLGLSVFDGAHCFLFVADMQTDGTLKGYFCSGAWNQTSFTAERGENQLPDPFELAKVTSADRTFSFDFPDLDGNRVSNSDDRFKGKPLIFCVLGTWCPNCHDGGDYLADLYRKYHAKGLEVVGLACEFSRDPAISGERVRRFKSKYGIEWPILLAGSSRKAKVTEALHDLDLLWAYPTFIFIDKGGKVKQVYTGFNGPGTGAYFERLQKEFTRIIESIL